MEVERVLVRVGPKKEEVIIDKNFFYCGRMKESDLVCLSLLVSREHCLFTNLTDGLYVTDLGSSNGVFVNGMNIRPKKQILLRENDYIGIGCAEITNLDDTMFVYKVKNRTVIAGDCSSTTSTSNQQDSTRLARKEQSKSRKEDTNGIPTKIAKTTENEQKSVNNQKIVIDDDDIEIIECSSSSSTSQKQIDKSDVQNKVTECSTASNSIEQKAKSPNVDKTIPTILPDVIDITDAPESHVHNHNNGLSNNIAPVHNLKSKPIIPDKTSTDATVATATVKQEPDNDINPSATVKEEPDWGCFSQIDLVEINDDDDSIFPFSQLFDKTSIKQESEETDDNQPHSSLFLDDDDDNIVTILDSDDENIYEITATTDIQPKVKIEPGLELVDIDSIINPPELIDAIVHADKTNVPTTEEVDSHSSTECPPDFDKTLQPEQPLPVAHEEPPEASTSKDTSLNAKTKRKGLEIIEPHFIKPKKRSPKAEKIDEKKSKSKKETEKKHAHKKRSSSSLISSLRKHSSSKSSSKSRSHRKDKDHSPSSSKKKNSNKDSKDDGKHKSSPSGTSKSDKDSIDNEKDKNLEPRDKIDSSSISETIRPRCKTTIVKVKVSSKTRGDMLCDAMQAMKPKPKKDPKKTDADTEKDAPPKPPPMSNSISSFVIPRRQIPSSSIPSTSMSMTSQLNTPPPKVHHKQNLPTVLTNTTNHLNFTEPPIEHDLRKSPLRETADPPVDDVEMPLQQRPLKSSLTIPSLLNTNQKKVSFKENIVAVREFPIEAGNKLKNIKCMDSPHTRSSRKDFSRSSDLKIEDFLARIFAWEPVWLEQQQKVKSLPPIVKLDDMKQLPNNFQSFEQYYKKMEVLLLLETWQYLVKEYECTGNRYNSSIALPCAIARHSIRQMQTPIGLRYSMMVINSLVTKNQLRLQNHPVYGDMIILEYVVKQGDVQKMRRAFAYVVQVQQQNSMKFLKSNELLCRHVPDPAALLTYTVQTRIIDEHTLQFHQTARLRSILYLRSHLRLVQGLQYVPHSALRDSILKVNIDEFQLEAVTQNQIHNYKIVTNEKLNERQTEAVIKFTNASARLEPKIGLLVGPPGTGKSKVIANLVAQILYGDARYSSGKQLRILVCAPSNAAIDEIVLRLLDIRSAIAKEHRFKMVRIGRLESMHEAVKKISLTELAQRQIGMQHHNHAENVEQKKHKLKMEIDALDLLVASQPNNRIYRRDLEELRAKYNHIAHKSPEQEAAALSKIQHSAKSVLLHKADVIACTLSSCYTSQMETIFGKGSSNRIGTCIVDEATQCCEAETLIPLMLGVKSLILVGDPNQLPATVMSTDAKKLGLDRSLFTRVKEALEPQSDSEKKDCLDPVIMLNVQYRMVNAISHWPNKYFYAGKLCDAVNYKQAFPFQPYRVLNLDGIQDDIKFSNTSEALFVGNLINCMMTCAKLSSWERKISVGIITPYQNQKSLILSTIKEQIKNVPDNIKSKFTTEVNTIDSFQGQERDVIIMSCVRSCGIGFMSDQQRLCVALTRAKFSLIICGNFTTFQRDNTWNDLLRDARSRGVVARLNTTAKPSEIKPHVVRL